MTITEIRQIMQNCGASLRAKDFKVLIDWLVQQLQTASLPNIIYVSNQSDKEDGLTNGSMNFPYKTLQAAIDSITEANRIIFVGPGDYLKEDIVIVGKEGLIITSYGNAKVGEVNISSSKGITLHNLDMEYKSIYISYSSNIYLREISNAHISSTKEVSNLLIEDCRLIQNLQLFDVYKQEIINSSFTPSAGIHVIGVDTDVTIKDCSDFNIQHDSGIVRLIGSNTLIPNKSGIAILSTADTGHLGLEGGTIYSNNGNTQGVVLKTGYCPYTLTDFILPVSSKNFELNGNRIAEAFKGIQVFSDAIRNGYKHTYSHLESHLDGISDALEVLKNQLNSLWKETEVIKNLIENLVIEGGSSLISLPYLPAWNSSYENYFTSDKEAEDYMWNVIGIPNTMNFDAFYNACLNSNLELYNEYPYDDSQGKLNRITLTRGNISTYNGSDHTTKSLNYYLESSTEYINFYASKEVSNNGTIRYSFQVIYGSNPAIPKYDNITVGEVFFQESESYIGLVNRELEQAIPWEEDIFRYFQRTKRFEVIRPSLYLEDPLDLANEGNTALFGAYAENTVYVVIDKWHSSDSQATFTAPANCIFLFLGGGIDYGDGLQIDWNGSYIYGAQKSTDIFTHFPEDDPLNSGSMWGWQRGQTFDLQIFDDYAIPEGEKGTGWHPIIKKSSAGELYILNTGGSQNSIYISYMRTILANPYIAHKIDVTARLNINPASNYQTINPPEASEDGIPVTISFVYKDDMIALRYIPVTYPLLEDNVLVQGLVKVSVDYTNSSMTLEYGCLREGQFETTDSNGLPMFTSVDTYAGGAIVSIADKYLMA